MLQARVAKHIAAEAEWLRLLCEELQPVMAHLQDNSPSRSAPRLRVHACSLHACRAGLTPESGPRCAGLQASLQAVADRALQVGEAAIASYRAHRSSRAENAAILRQAVRPPRPPCAPWVLTVPSARAPALASLTASRAELDSQVRVVALVTRCAVTDGADLSGLLEEQLLAAAHVRCRVLLATVGAPPVSAPRPCSLPWVRVACTWPRSLRRILVLRNAAA